MKNFIVLLFLTLGTLINSATASDEHPHNEVRNDRQQAAPKVSKETTEEHHDEDEHEKEKSHDEHKEKPKHTAHGEKAGEEHHEDEGHEEENSQIGSNKGILEAHKEKGFRLSPEAEKNFELEKVKVSSDQLEIPSQAVVTAGVEVNLYRLREGFYSRIDFTEVRKSANNLVIKSKDLKPGDEIVVKGLGFLRMTEIAAFDGAPAGHSH